MGGQIVRKRKNKWKGGSVYSSATWYRREVKGGGYVERSRGGRGSFDRACEDLKSAAPSPSKKERKNNKGEGIEEMNPARARGA